MLVLSELLQASLEVLASDPSSLVKGRIWLNSTENLIKYYDGTSIQTSQVIAGTYSAIGALTRVAGKVYYATDNKRLYLDAGSSLIEVGSDIYGDSISIGSANTSNKRIIINNAEANKPEIRYNDSTNVFEFSNDGVVFTAMGAGGNAVSIVTSNTNMSVKTDYFTNSASKLEMTLPTTAAIGDSIRVTGMGAGGWKILQNANQYIKYRDATTIVGTSGILESSEARASVLLVCTVTNNEWVVSSDVGGASAGFSFQGTVAGYICLGNNGGTYYYNSNNKFNFSSETIGSVASLDLADAINRAGGLSSSTKGFIVGGFSSASACRDYIKPFTFAVEVFSTLSATLDEAKYIQATCSSSLKGYTLGGYTGSASAKIEYLEYSSEISQAISATLDTPAYFQAGLTSNAKGYSLGNASSTTTIEDLIFATETSAPISATLDVGRGFTYSGICSNIKGYVCGGNTYLASIEDLNYGNETSAIISATLDVARADGSGLCKDTTGYMAGGTTGSVVDTMENIVFSNETSAGIAATLSNAKLDTTSVQD